MSQKCALENYGENFPLCLMLGSIKKDSMKDFEQREEFKGRDTKKEWLKQKHQEGEAQGK